LIGIPITVPGDLSSAAFFLVAGSIVPGADVRLPGVGINPTRTGLLDVLAEMGANIVRENERVIGGEPLADLRVQPGRLRATSIGGAQIPRLIDELPVLAVLASQAPGETVVRDATELRHKESDRVAAIVAELGRLGADIRERPDGFVVRGPTRLRGRPVDAHGDHRIAMALAVAALVADGATTLAGSEAVGISYPGFFADLSGLVT
jgi:3-phosphoshikimate 1-carboxyvinyltransferase